jgi:type III secretory pathway component EscT
MTFAILGLRGAAAIGILLALVGGIEGVTLVAVAVATGLWTALLVAPGSAVDAAPWLLLHEVAIGAALGIAAAVPLVAARAAGLIVDRAAGGHGIYRRLLDVITGAVFFGVDGHVAVVRAIVMSHRAVPAMAEVRPRVTAALASLMPSAVVLAAPWLVTTAILAIAFGIADRVAARTATHTPTAVGAPTIVAMMTAALVAAFATALARLVIAA